MDTKQGLQDIISDGYNMKVVSLTKNNVVISIGGSERKFSLDLSLSLSEQIDTARVNLGCTKLSEYDASAIDLWQALHIR